MKEDKIAMKLNEAINAGKDSKGNVMQIPVFTSIKVVNGELYGVIEGYVDPPSSLQNEKKLKH